MELPSSIPKTEFVHNAAAFIPFSYGELLCFEIGGELLTHTCPMQVQPTASGSRWRFSVNDFPDDGARFILSKSYNRTSHGDCKRSPGSGRPV